MTTASLPAPGGKSGRLVSLDVFRGITIAAMLLVNNPGSWSHIYAPLEHAEWHGWTMTDLIFPFFLWIVGVAIPFSMAKRSAEQSRGQMLGHIWLRALSLFMLGQLLTAIPAGGDDLPEGFWLLKSLRFAAHLFVWASILALLIPWRPNRFTFWLPPIVFVAFYLLMFAMWFANQHALGSGLPAEFGFGRGAFRPERLRIPGVLQRIGICYGVAATIALFAGRRMIVAAALVLMAGYSILMLKAPLANHVTGSLTQQDNFARHVDVRVLDRLVTASDGAQRIIWKHSYSAYPDPEGIVSTLPAIATVLLGILAGMWLRTDRPPTDRCLGLLGGGVLVTIAGVLLDWWLMPINKNLWTPSFTVFTGGIAMLGLGTVFWLVDLLGRRRWALPFVIYGMNSIAAFVVAGALVRLGGMIRFADPLSGRTVNVIGYSQDRIARGMHHASDWMQSVSPHLPVIDSPNMTSLAYAIAFVLVVLVLMSILYMSRIFVKV